MSRGAGLHPVGPRGVLVDLQPEQDPAAFADAARERSGWELEDVVPGHASVLLHFAAAPGPAVLADVAALAAGGHTAAGRPARTLDVEVVYDGDDLEAVAEHVGCEVAGVVALHTAPLYRVAFLGMAGFPYLVGGDPRLALPRRPTPRTSVPRGAVAVAAGYSGIYPRASPGGWHLLGRTAATVFDPAASPPAAFAAGDRVRLHAGAP